MQYAKLTNILANIGLPLAYREFKDQTQKVLPYIVYYYDGSDDVYADNINYQEITVLRIELYTKDKDFATERMVEAALMNAGIAYSKDEVFIEDQKMYEIIYESEVVING